MKKYLLLLFALICNSSFSQSFHDTQGKLDISSSGQATFVLPIAMPPSIQDVGPVINLVYSSGQTGGIAGQGWNISSISNISRVATRLDIDGFIDGVDFDNNDKLALDGQRLLLKTGNYWENGSTYETEVQSNNKIEQFGSGESMYFIVTSSDGSQTYYGNYGGNNGIDTTAFYIVKYLDANGNYINYSYSYPNGFNSMCVSEIKFSANRNSNTEILNKIIFNYVHPNRSETDYIKGIKKEKSVKLYNITVFTSNTVFKKYDLIYSSSVDYYDKTGNNYDKLIKIEENNGNGEKANPIEFEYNKTDNTLDIVEKSYSNNLDFNSTELSGDFDGDGSLDFTTSQNLYKKLFKGDASQSPISLGNVIKAGGSNLRFTATTLKDNKLNNFQSIIKGQPITDGLNFKVFNLSNSNSFIESYSKMVHIGLPNEFFGYSYSKSKHYEGDFNGDGISEVLIISTPTVQPPVDPWDPCHIWGTCELGNLYKNYHILDLKQDASTAIGSPGFVKLPESDCSAFDTGKLFIADFNNDRKSDILWVNGGQYELYTFIQLSTAPWIKVESLGHGYFPEYSDDKPFLIGDYNADGKIDIMIPVAVDSYLWTIYYGNPKPQQGLNIMGEYFKSQSINGILYHPTQNGLTYSDITDYYSIDFNKDGKTDLVSVYRNRYFTNNNDHDTSWRVKGFTNNIGGYGAYAFNQTIDSGLRESESPEIPIPITSNYRFQGCNYELVLVRPHYNVIEYYKFNKNVLFQNNLKKVTQSGGSIIDEIEYKPFSTNLDYNNGNYYDPTEFYSNSNSVSYPFFEIKSAPNSFLVSKLTNTTLGVSRKQNFKYSGYTLNLNGLGPIGFKKTARSSWYIDDIEKKVWSVIEIDPLKRGTTIKQYSVLLNGSATFNFDSSESSNWLSKVENIFTETLDPITKKYTVLLKNQKSFDLKSNIINEKKFNIYSIDYLLPESVTTNSYLGTELQGSVTTKTSYESNIDGIGFNYYIGRPFETTTTVSAYNDTKTNRDNYFYTESNISRIEKRSNNSPVVLVEEMTYYPNGNLESKTISAEGTNTTNEVASRTTTYTYDDSNRFVKSIRATTLSDQVGLTTINDEYHPLYGVVLKQTNPFGQISKNVYDNWGKRTKITDFLGKSLNYTYERINNHYVTTEYGDDGSSSKTFSDALGRVVIEAIKGVDGNWIYKNFEYDYKGRKYKESEPYFYNESPSQWNFSEYDDYGRTIKSTAFTGKITKIEYNGLTIITNDGTKSKSTTKNANNHVVRTTDTPGGIINFTYFANGQLKSSNYDNVVISMEYDDWGRKAQLTDPSAGTYTYAYNAFGETIYESTPKGKTTIKLNEVGKVLQKSIIGNTEEDHTNILSDYEYDNSTKLLKQIKVTNPFDGDSSYEYKYDNLLRIIQTTENLKQATFYSEIEYDSFGRVDSETKTAKAFDKSSTTKTINSYKNGVHWQILDEAKNVLWELNTANARGQVTSTTLGNGITTANTYDVYGYPSQIKHEKNNTNIMTLGTQFEPILGNLSRRTNSMFDKTEYFHYDALDRLESWSGGVPEIYCDITFPTSTEEFTYYGDPQGGISNNNQRLKVIAKGFESGVSKTLTSNVPVGKILDIQFDMIYVAGLSGLYVEIYESNPLTGQVFNLIELGEINNVTTQTQYVVQHNNVDIVIRFYIDTGYEKSINQNTAQGPPPPGLYDLIFYIDNVLVSSQQMNHQNYDDRGRIRENNLGVYNYEDAEKAYQNTSIDIPKTFTEYYKNRPLQNISYNAFKSPIVIEEQGIETISFEYNFMQNRSAMYYGTEGRKFTKIYSADGSMEIKWDEETQESTFITYIGGDAYSAPILTKSNGLDRNSKNFYFYLHRDYQSTILAVTNSEGSVVEKRLFDAWGSVLEVQDGYNNILSGLTFFDRGYTGHEHLQGVALIHMNGRLYDPKLHRFLQPDNFVQDPYNTQNYNRYGYCLNNPLKYTDPSGEELATATIAVIVSVFISVTTSVLNAVFTDVPFDVFQFVSSIVISVFSAGVTNGIGVYAQTIGNLTTRVTFQALAHGAFQGTLTAIQGGNFWNGAAAGALSSIASSLWAGGSSTKEGFFKENNYAHGTQTTNYSGIGAYLGMDNTVGMITFGTIAGGAGAALTGGNFWQGAVTGLMVSGLNHALHSMDQEDPQQPPKKTPEQRQQEALDNWMSDMKDFNEFLLEARTLTAGLEFKMPSWSSVKSLFTLGTKNIMLEGKLANHLFKGTGKLADTAANRALITKISNGKSLGVDAYGKSWYAKTLGNGTQIYSYSQNGIIKGAGLNQTPVNIIARYGLK